MWLTILICAIAWYKVFYEERGMNSYLTYTLMKAFLTAVAIPVVEVPPFPVVYVVLASFSVVNNSGGILRESLRV